ncbi:MAG: RsiV family protein [Acinetobacter sp.]
MNQQWLWAVPVSFAALVMTGCQERPAPKTEQTTTTKQQAKSETIPLIQAKVVPVKLSKPEACEAEGCMQYDIQTVETNVKWIDDYFIDRVKKADPIAFSTAPNQKINTSEGANPNLSQSSTYIRFVSQQYDQATFAIQTYTYSAGAAHGMYHQEFVNFDLKNKKRLALQDIVVKGAEQQVLDTLYDSNSLWLDQHSIEREKLKLSDNFYFGANGIVFVYPLYELASYAEGMTELTLPYVALNKLVKAEYLPSLPKYPSL